jgi:hypothetical protein
MKNLLMTAILFAVYFTVIAQNKTTLTALFDKNTKNVKLRWQNITDGLSYILQSSRDNNTFTDIFILKASDVLIGDFIKYNDNNPVEGKNYYRLKIYKKNDKLEILPTVLIVSGNTENTWVIYPVPIGTVLNLQYNGNNPIDGVITVLIQSVTSGTVFTRLRVASTTRKIVIPISNIGKGTYDIRIYVSDNIVWNQRVIKY